MILIRAFFALAAGFIVLMALQALATLVLRRRIPQWADVLAKPTLGYTVANGGILLLAAAAGGFVTAQLAQANPLIHTLGLAIITMMLAALTAMQSRGKQPIWYLLLMLAIAPLGVFFGGIFFLRIYGIL